MKILKYFLFIFLFIISTGMAHTADDIYKLFPGNNEVGKWNRSGEIRSFIGDKLWEYIDGGAEIYYMYGFKRVVTCDYKEGSKSIVLDVYEMGDVKNAFGIYSAERDPKYKYIKVGVQGYQEGTSLNFWKGNYYIKLTTFDKTADTKNALLQFGKAVEKRISGYFVEPAAINLFPKQNQITNSAKYFSKDILGHKFLYNGFTADYKDGNAKFKVFIIDAGNQKAAQGFYTNFKNFMNQSKNFEKDIKNLGNEALLGKDAGRRILIFYNSKVMAGVVGLDDEGKAVKILQEIAKK